MTQIKEIEAALFQFAPKELSQSWDNVGLLVGDPEGPVERILVALDVTEAVVEEAAAAGCELIVAHHPLMNCAWHPVQSIRMDDAQGRLITALIQNRIAAVCMHTNLDAAAGGVNDCLALALGLMNIVRLDEESGIGRVGSLTEPMDLAAFASYVKKRLGANGVRYANGGREVHKVAVGGGVCGEYAALARDLGCDTFVTADLKYHDFQNAAPWGLNLIDAGHFPTEDVVCPQLVNLLEDRFPALTIIKSTRHSEVIQYV